MKKISSLMLLALALFFLGCRSELVDNSEVNGLSPNAKPDSTGMYKMKDVPVFSSYLKRNLPNACFKSDNSEISDDNQLVDVINKNDKISYSTLIKKENNVHQIWIYTVGEKESFFIAEYISSVTSEYFELEKFTGTVEYRAIDGEILGTENFENGKPLKNASSKAVCGVITTPISCIEGLHFGNQPCAWAGTSNAAYYNTEIIRCKSNYQNTIYNDGGAYGSSGGATNPAYHLPAPQALNHMLAQIGMPILNSQQFAYVQNNIPIAERLRTFFFTDQTVKGSNFLYWGIDFLIQNPTTTWMQFQPMLTFLHNFVQDNPNMSSHFLQYPEDLNKILFKGLNYNNISDVTFANKFALAFTEILIAEKNNTVSQVNVQNPTWTLAKEYMIYLIKQNAASAVKYGRVIYEHSSQYFSQHPNSLQKVNEFVDYLKAAVEFEIPIEQNHQYMKWTDILLCWLFEIGDFQMNDSAGYGNLPTIGFSGTDYTIKGIPSPNIIPMRYLSAHKIKNGVPDVNSVLDLKRIAINNIQNGVLTPINGEWVFGSDATVETITKLDGMQFCLGSYRTDVYITALGGNQYKLTYIIKNKTGWQSGTRGLNDYNGNPTDDSIIPDKPRGTGVHLGGTIGQTFGWYEIITVN